MKYTEIINSNPYVLVEFYASWCPHCQKMMPIVAEIKKLLADTLKVEQFDIDEYQDLASEAGAESIPTFILYHNGEDCPQKPYCQKFRNTHEISTQRGTHAPKLLSGSVPSHFTKTHLRHMI